MLSSLLGILCGLSLAVFATLEPRLPRVVVAWAPAFVLTLMGLGFARQPDTVWMSVGIAACASLALFWPRWSWLAVAGGGAAAAVWATLLANGGVPRVLAVATVLTIAASCATLAAKRPVFAPQILREEALALVLGLALVVATAPAVVAGFSAAAALTAEPLGTAGAAQPGWPLALAGTCVLLGGIYSAWRRR